ncbi:hypothetical protein ACIBF1_44155 [Spirillospora sp. NPDC050679]
MTTHLAPHPAPPAEGINELERRARVAAPGELVLTAAQALELIDTVRATAADALALSLQLVHVHQLAADWTHHSDPMVAAAGQLLVRVAGTAAAPVLAPGSTSGFSADSPGDNGSARVDHVGAAAREGRA